MKFEKVSSEVYVKHRDLSLSAISEYEKIILPYRHTAYSAGYDFFAPYEIIIKPQETVKVITGVKCLLDQDKVLTLYIRSSLGIKKKIMLANITGVIDADYYNNPDNEGLIIIALYNYGNSEVTIQAQEHFAQGVISNYYLVENDEVIQKRTGGIGSTNKEKTGINPV